MKNLIRLSLIAMLVASCNTYQHARAKITRYEKGVPICVSDFTLTYLGYPEKRYSPYGYRAYDFIVSSKSGNQIIHYINGGEVFPIEFEVEGEKYVLELFSSLALNTTLEDNQLVLWKQDDWKHAYDSAIKKHQSK